MEIAAIPGVGKAIAGKILELLSTGEMATLEKWRSVTPEGVRKMLQVKGFGPKKIGVIWKEMGIETIGELLYACHENRLVELKGFGHKTQAALRDQLEYFMQAQDLYHFASLYPIAEKLIDQLYEMYPDERHEFTGDLRRNLPILDQIDLITTAEAPYDFADGEEIQMIKEEDSWWDLGTPSGLEIRLHLAEPDDFGTRLFQTTHSAEFTALCLKQAKQSDLPEVMDEETIFEQLQLPYVKPELRELVSNGGFKSSGERSLEGWQPNLIEEKDIKGVVHAHSTYSDGLNSIKQMALRAQELGYEYLGLTDHSKSAFYADGLQVDRLEMQWAEIDRLNKEMEGFTIFKGIESDILNTGQLDYEEAILKQFDFIIASVHSNLKMDEAKATKRLITAVEQPYTTMLGHPTGRLLLSRRGYPIDYVKVIDACAANGVAIEINASPYRLDLDWEWIPYALHKGVKIAINPDAHSLGGIKDIKWGLMAARKGGLTAEQCICAYSAEEFSRYCQSKSK